MTTSTPPRPAANRPVPTRTIPAATFREPVYTDGQTYRDDQDDEDDLLER